MVYRQRLRLHDVEAGGGDLTAGQRRHQILLVHNPSCTVQRTVTLPPQNNPALQLLPSADIQMEP
jgi:hypothetical protein